LSIYVQVALVDDGARSSHGDDERSAARDDARTERQKHAHGAARNARQTPAHRPHASTRPCTTHTHTGNTSHTLSPLASPSPPNCPTVSRPDPETVAKSFRNFSLYETSRDTFPTIFNARCYASAVLAMGLCPSVCVRLSQLSRCSTKTAKRRIKRTTPHDTPRTLMPKISAKFDRGHPLRLIFDFNRNQASILYRFRDIAGYLSKVGAPNAGGVGQNRRLSTNNRLYLENGTR